MDHSEVPLLSHGEKGPKCSRKEGRAPYNVEHIPSGADCVLVTVVTHSGMMFLTNGTTLKCRTDVVISCFANSMDDMVPTGHHID